MIRTTLFVLTLTVSNCTWAGELNDISTADIKMNFAAAVPAPSVARTYPALSAAPVCEAAMVSRRNSG